MDYQIEKGIQFKLEEAHRMQRHTDFVRQVRAQQRRDRRAAHRSIPRRLWSWTPVRVLRERAS